MARSRDWLSLVHLIPIRPRISTNRAADRAYHARTKRGHRYIVGKDAYVEHRLVVAVSTVTPNGEGAHAVGAHVAEGHEFRI